jgi:tRNA dimethylallyltransferase
MTFPSGKTAIIIVGPTASGKSAAALRLARQLGTSIISADSRQCYREMSIGVAKPTAEELSSVRHYFISSHSIHDPVDAVVFEQEALQAANEIFATRDQLVMAGGTGLYVRVFTEGIDDMPAVEETIKLEVRSVKRTVGELQLWLEKIDPDYLRNTTEPGNPVRLMRAIEVKLSTGRSILSYRKGRPKKRDFNIVRIGIDLPRETLYRRINDRVDRMMDQGLFAEAQALFPHRHLDALQTVGYQELFDHLEGKYSLDEAVAKIRQHTRNYAKRQLTWFRREQEVEWNAPLLSMPH